jgi:hypothetical protein
MNDARTASSVGLDPRVLTGIAPTKLELDGPDRTPTLPGDHPAWQRDVLSVSSRTRALLGALKPLVVAVVTFWDHALRELRLGTGRLSVDPSGSYRLRP